ncbi:MAG: hypothetical protein QFE16_00855 [Pseudomonadota bacterium]|nr:hypothetical protein [Pseudomonadota bacterium]
MSARRLRELALQRDLLVLRAALQRELLHAEWQASTAPLARFSAAVGRSRDWLGPVAAVGGVPLLWMLKRRSKTWMGVARWALTAWPVIRVARKLMRR